MTLGEGRRTRREALKKQIRTRLIPRLLELGFTSTRTAEGRAAWPGYAEQRYGYARLRHGRLDRLDLRWDKWGRPWFIVDFRASDADARSSMGEMIAGEVQAVRASGFLKFMGMKQRWFGRGHSPDLAVSLAVRGMEDLNLFLLTGEASPHVEVTQVGCHRVSRALTDLDFLLIWLLAPIVVLSLPAKLFRFSAPAARAETAREL